MPANGGCQRRRTSGSDDTTVNTADAKVACSNRRWACGGIMKPGGGGVFFFFFRDMWRTIFAYTYLPAFYITYPPPSSTYPISPYPAARASVCGLRPTRNVCDPVASASLPMRTSPAMNSGSETIIYRRRRGGEMANTITRAVLTTSIESGANIMRCDAGGAELRRNAVARSRVLSAGTCVRLRGARCHPAPALTPGPVPAANPDWKQPRFAWR